MKHLLFTMLIALGFATTSYASTADLFSFNSEAIEAEFAQINQFETYVASHEGLTFTDMQNEGTLNQFDLNWNSYDASAAPMFGISDMDWNSFVCGFCCWPVGIFTVLLNDDKDSDSKISYGIGVLVSLILGSIGGTGYYSSGI